MLDCQFSRCLISAESLFSVAAAVAFDDSFHFWYGAAHEAPTAFLPLVRRRLGDTAHLDRRERSGGRSLQEGAETSCCSEVGIPGATPPPFFSKTAAPPEYKRLTKSWTSFSEPMVPQPQLRQKASQADVCHERTASLSLALPPVSSLVREDTCWWLPVRCFEPAANDPTGSDGRLQ